MRKWEDIVKDKMEVQEGSLPDSVFAEFRTRISAAKAPSKKRFPTVWVMSMAVAAALAVILLLHGLTGDEIRTVRQPSSPVAVASDSSSASEYTHPESLVAEAVTSVGCGQEDVKQKEMGKQDSDLNKNKADIESKDDVKHKALEKIGNTEPKEGRQVALGQNAVENLGNIEQKGEVVTTSPDNDINISETDDTVDTISSEIAEENKVKEPDITTASPFLPERKDVKTINIKAGPAAGAVAGGSVLAAVASVAASSGKMSYEEPVYQDDPSQIESGTDPETPKDKCTDAVNHFPLKVGLSARIHVAERLYITTGLDYSLYKSSFTYSLSGKKVQNAHYIGIPLRLDWTLASNRWLDVYFGGGLEGDYCLSATLDGDKIHKKDGFSASLLAVGGIQFKLTKRLGLYVEPELNWRFTPESPALETYRNDNPLMFSVTSGLRITIGK